MKKALTGCSVALMSLFIVSCATSPIPVSSTFWQDRNAKVVVAVSKESSQGHLYKEGQQGLLDYAINSAMTHGPDNALERVDRAKFNNVKETFAQELRKRGLQATVSSQAVDIDSLPKHKEGTGLAGRDFSSVLESNKADYLIVLSPGNYGAVRSYYGFIPTSNPKGMAQSYGVMVKKGQTKPAWYTGEGITNRMVEPVAGDWDQSPHYTNLVKASERALEYSAQNLKSEFFN